MLSSAFLVMNGQICAHARSHPKTTSRTGPCRRTIPQPCDTPRRPSAHGGVRRWAPGGLAAGAAVRARIPMKLIAAANGTPAMGLVDLLLCSGQVGGRSALLSGARLHERLEVLGVGDDLVRGECPVKGLAQGRDERVA
jgi:hypothetical protein